MAEFVVEQQIVEQAVQCIVVAAGNTDVAV